MNEGGALHGGDLFKRPNPFNFGDFIYNGKSDMVEALLVGIHSSFLQYSIYIYS